MSAIKTYQRQKRPATIDQSSIMVKKKMKVVQIDNTIPVTVLYQRLEDGVEFEAELSKAYNPTYFFLQISNQIASYDEMYRELKFDPFLISYSICLNLTLAIFFLIFLVFITIASMLQ